MSVFVLSRADKNVRVRVCAANPIAVSLEIPQRDGYIYKVIPRSVFEECYVSGEVSEVIEEGGDGEDHRGF